MNSELNETILQTVEALKYDERVITYHTIKKLIENDTTLSKLWEKQKEIQKELVHAKAYGLTNQKTQLELSLSEIEIQLKTHPLMEAYDNAYARVEELQKEIEEIVFGK